jgi:hypothetical protein
MATQSTSPRQKPLAFAPRPALLQRDKSDDRRTNGYREQWMKLAREYFSPYACRR